MRASPPKRCHPDSTAAEGRDYYALRTDIEERHRQVKCFWDLTRFPSTAWNLIVSQTVFVSLTYSLLQLHLLQYGHQELNRRTPETTRRLLPDGDRPLTSKSQRHQDKHCHPFAGRLYCVEPLLPRCAAFRLGGSP